MPLPSEFVIEDAVGSINDLIIYRAEHPIHGTVTVYQPDNNLPPEPEQQVKKRLYQCGLRMRDITLLNIRYVTKALEVSQNPKEPYIVTEYAKYDIEELISNGVTIKPKRMFVILSQVLQAIVNLSAKGWAIHHINTKHIKLPELHTGDISLTVMGDTDAVVNTNKIDLAAAYGTPSDSETTAEHSVNTPEDGDSNSTAAITRGINDSQTPKGKTYISSGSHETEVTAQFDEDKFIEKAKAQLRNVKRNIYFLGNITYQLLFGRKYQSSDKVSVENIRRLGRRWRKILEKALSENIEHRYHTYEDMLRDVRKASNRNKRLAIASIPFLIILAGIASYFAYGQYREYRIMTSEAGQAIESFLNIVNETEDELPELKKPEPPPSQPNDVNILNPFEKVEPLDKG